MKKPLTFTILFWFCLILAVSWPGFASAQDEAALDPDDWSIHQKIEALTGALGVLDEKENVFKVSFPRSDIQTDVLGAKLSPAMGLTAWAAFKPAGDQTIMLGELALQEEQVNPVMTAVLDNELNVTALHNDFLWDSLKIMFMNISGTGDPEKLAAAVGKVFAKIKETSGGKGQMPPYFEVEASKTTLDPKKIDGILGQGGTMEEGVYVVIIGRASAVNGRGVGSAMGIHTRAAFMGSDERAVVGGNFAVTEKELQPVLKALRGAGINVVAVHNHLTRESPRMIFVDFWGVGTVKDLGEGLKSALDTQKL